MALFIIMLLLTGYFINGNLAWDSEELEIFDLVEEINTNFYDFMQIEQNATSNEVKRAFRGLSIVLHPDKNPAEDANIQFRNLVSIYEVLKDYSKREKYDKVLKDGLPDWKSALYYYRRMRKIGLYEGAFILFIIISIGQYLFAWAAYLEKKYTAEQVIGTKLKKLQKKNRNIDMDTILNEIPAPSLLNTLPIQLPLAIWNLPTTIKNAFKKANELKEIALEKRRQELEAAKRQEELEREFEEQTRLKREKKEELRKRKQNTKAPEKTDEDLMGYSQIHTREVTEEDAVKPVLNQKTTVSGGFWTDEDLAELVRLVKKYPSGAGSRWNTIAEIMNRTVQEVTFMAAKMKESGYRIPGQTDSVAEHIAQQTNDTIKKEKTKKINDKNILVPETNWSQEQQRALEVAIVKYRKNITTDRWQKIANCVPEKTKEECLQRYKYLCDLVKAQKKLEAEEAAEAESVAAAAAAAEAETVTQKPIAELRNRKSKTTITQSSEAVDTVQTEEQTVSSAEAEVDEDEVEIEDVEAADEEVETNFVKVNKKRSKRKERRKRRDLDSDEDSDDAYQYEINK